MSPGRGLWSVLDVLETAETVLYTMLTRHLEMNNDGTSDKETRMLKNRVNSK